MKAKLKQFMALAAFAFAACFGLNAQAANVATLSNGTTSTSYATIAEAVAAYNDATVAGAYVIEVLGGEYPLSECEIKQSTTKSLTIRPVKTGDTFATVKLNFNGNDSGAVFKINGGSDYNTQPTVIDHFDFDFGSKAWVYGVLMMSQSPNWYASLVTISNCDFVGENFSEGDSAWTCMAAGCGSKSSPSDITIANCTATKMWSIWNGYLNNNVGGLTVRDCTLSNCSYFVGVTDGTGNVVVDKCDVQLVGAGIRAYAIRLKNGSSSSATVTNSKFALDEGYCAFVGWIGSSGYAPNVKSFYVDDYTAKNITGDSRLADVLNRTTGGLSGTDVKVYLNNSLVATVTTTSSTSSGDCNTFFFTAAQIGETKYLTLQEAFDAVTEGQTIEVLRDNTEEITVSKTFAFTIDSNGYTLGSVAPTCATGWKFVTTDTGCSYVEKTKIYVGEGEGKQTFYDTKSAMMAALGTAGGTTVDFTTFAYEKTTIDTKSEDVSFNTTGTWLLTNGEGALFNYEVQLNSGKSADVAPVMNIEGAKLTAGKVNLYTNAKMTIKDSTVDFEQFQGGSSWFGVKKNSSLEIDNSTVGNKTAGFDAGVATFFGPTFRIYGPMTLKNNSTLYSSVGSSYAAGEALNVCGNGSLSATGSTIYMAALNLGNEFGSNYFLGDASVATSASITLDDAKVYNTQYAGDNIQDRADGMIIGDGSTHAGVLTLKNGSVFDLTGANANQLKRITVNANGTIAIDATSQIKCNAINNAGVIEVDMTGATEMSYTLIDASAESTYGTAGTNYKFADGKDNRYELKVVDNDLVAEKICVAQIGETKYVTLEDAIKAVDQDGTITIINNVDETFTAAPKSGVTAFTIVKGSYTLDGKVDAPADYKFVMGDNGCTFQAKDYVVQIGETKYEKLSEALLPLDKTGGDTVTITVLKSFSEELEEPKRGYSFKRDLAFVGADDDAVYTMTLENEELDIDIYGLSFAQNIELDAGGTYFGGDEIVFNGEANVYGVDCGVVQISETAYVCCAEVYVDEEALLKIASGTLVATDKILVTGKIEIDASKATTTPIKVIEFDYDGMATTDPEYGTVEVIKGYSYVEDNDLYVALNFFEDPETEGTWHIVNGNGLAEFAASVSAENTYAGKTIVLDNNIDMSSVEDYTPAAGFAGTFDGQGHTISGLQISGTTDKVGLFSHVSWAAIKNVTIDNATVTGSGSFVGALVGHMFQGTVESVSVVNSTITGGGSYVGGLIGHTVATVKNCVVTGNTINGKDQVGGVSGYLASGSIRNCTVSNDVTATEERAGGIAGKAQTDSGYFIENNTVSGTATAPDMAGGVCAQIMGTCANYAIKSNEIDVVLSAKKVAPLGVLRDGQSASYTSTLATHCVANWWTDATLAANSYTYTNVGDDVADQTIYRGVAGIDEQDTNYKTLAAALAAVQENQTIEIYADNGEVLTITRTVPFTFKSNGHTLGAAPTLPDGYIFVKSGDVCAFGLAVAQVGDNKYLTLKAAADAATSGDTVALLVNYAVASDEVVEIKDGVTFTAGSYTLTNNGTVKVEGAAKFSATSFTGNAIVFGEVGADTTITTDGLTVAGSGKIVDGSTVALSGNGFNFSSMFRDSAEDYNKTGHIGYALNIQDADLFQTYGFYVNTGSVVSVSNVKALDTTYFNIYGGTMNVTGADKLQNWARAGENINVAGAFNLNKATAKTSILHVYAGIDGKQGAIVTAEDSIITSRFVTVGNIATSDYKYHIGTDASAAMNLKDSSLLVWNVAGESASTFKIGSATTYGTLTLDNSTVDFNHNTAPFFCPMNITVGANGTIRMNASSSIAATTVSNDGVIEVDMTGATGASYTLVDADDTSTYGTLGMNYKFAEGKDNRYVLTVADNDLVANKIFVAQIGEAKYASLADALKAAESGDVIEVLDGTWDAISVGTLTTQEASAVRGKTLTIQPADGATVTFTASIYIGYDNSTTANAKITVKDIAFENASLSLVNYNQVDVENCTFNGFGDGSAAGLYIADPCCINHLTSEEYPASQVTIKDCTFDGKNTAGAAIRIRNCGNATISGNTIANVDGNGITFEANSSADNSAAKNITVDGNGITEWNVGNKSGGGRAIRFECGALASGSAVTIENNTMTKSTLNCDEPDFVKITSAANATVSLENNGWNNELTGTVSGNSAYYTVNGNSPEIKTTKSTKTAVAKIGTALYDDLADALNAAMTAGTTCELLCDVALEGNWTPITGFNGTFDGKNFTISGLTVEGTSNLGLFADTGTSATIKDLTITGAKITSTSGSNHGVLAGSVSGSTISNVKVLNSTVSAAGGQYTGGLCGTGYPAVSGCEISNCKVTGFDQVGGIIGYLWVGHIENCFVTNNTVVATSERAGGLVGKIQISSGNLGSSTMWVNGNTVSGTATAPDMAGGLFGQIMGDVDYYSISGNDVDVTFGTTPKTNPIGNLRDSQNAAFTGALAANITGNWWEDATLAADSYTYTNVGTGVEPQTIYRGVAQIVETGKCYKTFLEAVADATAGQTVQLIVGVSISEQLTISKSLKIDLNKKTLTSTVPNVRSIVVSDGAAVEICDGSIALAVENDGTLGLFDVTSAGSFVLTDVAMSGNTSDLDAKSAFIFCDGEGVNVALTNCIGATNWRIYRNNKTGGTLSVYGGTYTLDGNNVAFQDSGTATYENVTVSYGETTGNYLSAFYVNGGYALVKNCTATSPNTQKGVLTVCGKGTMDVVGGTYTGKYGAYVLSSGGQINITNATVTGTTKALYANTEKEYQITRSGIYVYGSDSFINGDMQVSSANTYITLAGGTYDRDPRLQFSQSGNQGIGLADGYAVTANGGDPATWSVVPAVASVTAGSTSTYYADLADAFAAAGENSTVTLLMDVDLAGKDWEPLRNTYLTFDGNGNTISNLTVTKNDIAYAGLFFELYGTVKNVTFANAKVTGQRCGVVAGACQGGWAVVSNVTVTGAKIIGDQKCGGIIGMIAAGGGVNLTVKNCTVDGIEFVENPDIGTTLDHGLWAAGGLIGYVGSTTMGTIMSNTVANVKIEDAHRYLIDHGGSPFTQNVSHAFIGSLCNINRTDKADDYTSSTVTLLDNETCQCPESEVYRYVKYHEFIGSYGNWDLSLSSTHPYPTRIIIDGVEITKPYAKIGDKRYLTLQAAFDAVQANETIDVLADNSETITVTNTCSFSFRSNGYKLGNAPTVAQGDYKFVYDPTTSNCTYQVKVYVAQIVTGSVTNKYETIQDAVDAAADGDTVTMIANVACDDTATLCTIAKGKSVILDLNGKTIASTGSYAKAFDLIQVFGTLVLTDSSEGQTGAMSLTSSVNLSWDYAVNLIWVGNGGALVVNGGNYTITTPSYGYAEYVICASNNNGDSDLIVNGGTFVGNNVDALIRLHNQEKRTGTHLNVTINGGTFTLNGNQCDSVVWLDVQTSGTNDSDCDLTVNGGVFTSNSTSPVFDIGHAGEATGFDVAIKGGSFKGQGQVIKMRELSDAAIAKTVLSGGFYSTNTYEIVRNKTTQGYASLNGLCIENSTITATGKADYPYGIGEIVWTGDETTAVVIVDEQSATVDTNATAKVVTDPEVAQKVVQNTVVTGVKLTPTNETHFVSGAQSVVAVAKATGTAEFASNLEKGTNVIIKVDVAVKPTLYVQPVEAAKEGTIEFNLTPMATVTIDDGGDNKTNVVEVTNEMIDQLQDIVVTVYTGFKPVQAIHTSTNGTVIQSFTADEIDYDEASGNASVTIHHFSNLAFKQSEQAAKIGDTYYATLQEAFDAAKAGETIELVKNVTVASTVSVTNSVTLDLGTYTVTGDGVRAIQVKSGTLTLAGSGKITNSGELSIASSVIRVGDNAATEDAGLVVGAGVTVETATSYAITAFGAKKESVVVYGTVKSTATPNESYDGCAISTLATDETTATITVNSGATVTANSNAIYMPSGTLTVNGGTITGASAIYQKTGTLTVNGGTLTGTAAKAVYTENGNGGNPTGSAIIIDNCNYADKGAPVVVIKGGTIVATAATDDVGSYAGSTVETNVTKFIQGGTFTHQIPAEQCADFFVPQQNEDGSWGVKVQTVFITDVAAAQRYPWNGLVDLSFNLKAAQDVKLFVAAYDANTNRLTMTTATLKLEGQEDQTVNVANGGFTGAATTTPTGYHLIWDSTEAAPGTKIEGVSFKVMAK